MEMAHGVHVYRHKFASVRGRPRPTFPSEMNRYVLVFFNCKGVQDCTCLFLVQSSVPLIYKRKFYMHRF
jgi:hypothetical protein